MHFRHDDALWRDFPALVPGVLYAEGITADAEPKAGQYEERARTRLAASPESEFPEIQAWRRAFAAATTDQRDPCLAHWLVGYGVNNLASDAAFLLPA